MINSFGRSTALNMISSLYGIPVLGVPFPSQTSFWGRWVEGSMGRCLQPVKAGLGTTPASWGPTPNRHDEWRGTVLTGTVR
jgi:hypothetical protein